MDLFSLILTTVIFVEITALSVQSFAKKGITRIKNARRRVFVDTSALMDGRILSVARTGFLGDNYLIPRSVIRELQLLADGSDSEKRSRARYGLDVVNELERESQVSANVFADKNDARVKVDERLLELAKKHHGLILTNDFNLAKVAATEHIATLNVNDLAQSVRSSYLPGDKLFVQIIGPGSNAKQGVAYLPDGTMVVVDDAQRFVGKDSEIEVEFVRFLQTSAGKMMFAKLSKNETQAKTSAKTTPAKKVATKIATKTKSSVKPKSAPVKAASTKNEKPKTVSAKKASSKKAAPRKTTTRPKASAEDSLLASIDEMIK